MRKKQLVPLSFLAIGSFFCGSCEKDIKTPGVFEPLYLDFSVSDTLGIHRRFDNNPEYCKYDGF